MANRKITMRRDNLADLPMYPVPPPYTLRYYQPGDKAYWLAIHEDCERLITVTPELFDVQFGTEEDVLSLRQLYICDEQGSPVATATAWYDDYGYGDGYGRVHWVAVREAHQGKGLAKALLTGVLRRLAELGYRRAYLTTSTGHLKAVSLYLKFGFVPWFNEPCSDGAWQEVHSKLKHPVLERFVSNSSSSFAHKDDGNTLSPFPYS